MKIELNIGLDIAGTANTQAMRDSRLQYALAALTNAGYPWDQSRRTFSSTEDTLILSLSVPLEGMTALRRFVDNLAYELDQDCIAVYNATAMSGELIGPNAAAWGTFNPEFFIRFDETAGPAVIYTPEAAAPAVTYTGHGAATGGLQGHSVGSDYPYMIVGVQDRYEAPTEWRVMDTRTSKMSDKFPTQQRAVIEMASLRVRNCMHS